MRDPYYEARDEVQKNIAKTKDMLDEWKVKFQNSNTAKSRPFQEIHSKIQGEIQQLQHDLQDMSECITLVENNRQKFRLDDKEVQARKFWLKESEAIVRSFHESVSGRTVNAKIESDQRQLLAGNRPANSEAHRRAAQENDILIEKTKQEQMQIQQQQDAILGELAEAIQRTHEIGRAFNVEVKDQAQMIKELESGIDRETEKMNFLMKRMGKVLKTSDNKQLWLIITLIIITVVLVFFCVS